MTPEALRDAVAMQVMGWSLEERDWAYSDRAEVWLNEAGAVVLTRYAWRPDEDDAQSMQVFDRLVTLGCEVQLRAGADGATVKVWRGGAEAAVASAPDRRRALLRAAAIFAGVASVS